MVDIDLLIKFENGELEDDAIIEMFAQLIASGKVWHLQGAYGRAAHALMEAGYIDTYGHVTPAWTERSNA